MEGAKQTTSGDSFSIQRGRIAPLSSRRSTASSNLLFAGLLFPLSGIARQKLPYVLTDDSQ
jgi:hypothetical protein